jgi:hypothetical protein
MSKKKVITRREFIKGTSIAAIGSSLSWGAPAWLRPESQDAADVVLVRNRDVLDESGSPKYDVVLEMLDAAVAALAKTKDPITAWKQFIKPHDVVGIKTNVWNFLPTTSPVENAIKKRVMDVGVPETNIGIKDRGVHADPFFQKATALINARPMRTHHWAGVGSCLKNMITFVPNPWIYHDDTCADLAKLWELPAIKGKVRLNILVMFTPLFHSVGPHGFSPEYTWKYYGLIVGVDPVAVDTTGVRIIQAKRLRHFGEDRPLNPPAHHISLADTRHHLGIADPGKINLIKIGISDDGLI